MSDTKTTKRKSAPVDKVDMTKPFMIVLHQTETRNVIEIFQGTKATEQAYEVAQAKASKGATVAVFGPQVAVYKPPEKPTATIVGLPWQSPQEAAGGLPDAS